MAMVGTKTHPSTFRIFISYRRADTSGHAGRLYEALEKRYGADQVFMDIDTIRPGADFTEVLDVALDQSHVLLALIGRVWIDHTGPHGQRRLDSQDDFVRRELERALAREITIIPVLTQGTLMPAQDQLPDSLQPLAARQAFELSDHRWLSDIRLLVQELDRLRQVAGVKRPWWRRRTSRPFNLAAGFGLIMLLGIAIVISILLRLATPPAQPQTQSTAAMASLSVDRETAMVGDAFTVKGINFPRYADVDLYYEYDRDSTQHRGRRLSTLDAITPTSTAPSKRPRFQFRSQTATSSQPPFMPY